MIRRLSIPILSLSLLAGCTDALGIGGDCVASMNLVRRTEGGPPQSTQGPTELSGTYEEIWFYFPGGARQGRKYSFRWGSGVNSCEMEGPTPVSRSKLPPREGGFSMSGDGDRR